MCVHVFVILCIYACVKWEDFKVPKITNAIFVVSLLVLYV